MVVTPKRKTLDEFLAMPGKKPALEYIDGEVIQKVSPSTPDTAGCGRLDGFVKL